MDQVTKFLQDLWALTAEPKNLLVFALLAIGYLCRQAEIIPNKFIPIIVLVCGLIFGPLIVTPLANGVLYGIAIAGLSTLLYEAVLRHVEDWLHAKFGQATTPIEPPKS